MRLGWCVSKINCDHAIAWIREREEVVEITHMVNDQNLY